MTAEQLRKSILQMAIQGKLVSQNPNDEPASVLLEKIKKERDQLIKEGKIKGKVQDSTIFIGDDNCPYEKVGKEVKNISDEIPFELPTGWAWCRLNTINDMYTGNSINETEKKKNYTGLSEGINYIGTKDVNFDKTICYDNGVKIPLHCIDKFRIAKSNSILLCIEGGSAGRKIAYTNQEVCFGNKLCCFNSTREIEILYAYYYLQSPTFLDVFKSETTGIIGGVSLNTLKTLLFALPPIAEQKRIVEKLEQLEPLIAEYDSFEKENAKLDKEIAEKLKKSILQYAIQGKLVKQDPTDEPASVLLDRILEERAKEQPKGKKSKQSTPSRIYKNSDDNSYYQNNTQIEVPFDIPYNWEWVTLGECLLPMKSIKPRGDVFTYVDIESIDNKNHKIKDCKILDVINAPSRATRGLNTGDVLFSMVRPYLENIALVTENHKNSIASTGFYVCKPNSAIISLFLFLLLKSKYYINSIMNFMKGDNSPSVNNKNVENTLIPLPPIEEQNRIVNAIEIAFDKIAALI